MSVRKRSAQRREDRAVGGTELGPLHLAAQDLELVAEHGDLDVLGVLASQASKQHAEESARHQVEEQQGHRRIIARPDPCCSAHPAEFLNPTGALDPHDLDEFSAPTGFLNPRDVLHQMLSVMSRV